MRPRFTRTLTVAVAACLAALLLLPGTAAGHAEREASFPDGTGQTPSLLLAGPTLLVCKANSPQLFSTLPTSVRQRNERLHAQCMESGFRHIQAAVDAVTTPNTRILVLPGVYKEEPSRRASAAGCGELEGGGNGDGRGTPEILSYEEQRACPHVQNLIAIFGDSDGDRACDLPQCGLQIEGTGSAPTDVIIDGEFRVLNGIRADRVDGVRFHNFTVQRFEFNALYVMETDGFLIHRVLGRWNDEYAFLTFAVDHGRYEQCEGYGNGDSAIYPGSASDIHADLGLEEADRYAVEISNCRGHHNALGYSGTAGNAVHVRDSVFDHNQTGIATDSLFPDHPGLPQDHAFFERNRIFSNNRAYVDYVHDGTCDAPFIERGYEHGIVCPVIPVPIGTGLFIAGGNYNRIERNEFYDNWRSGTNQIYVPAAARNEPENEGDTSHFNRYRGNRMGYAPGAVLQPNGLDFWWDDQGEGNCWQDNESNSGEITHNAWDPRGLPDCDSGGSENLPINPIKTSQIASCAAYSRDGNNLERDPNCDFFRHPERPADRMPAAPEMRRTGGAGAIGTSTAISRRAFPEGSNAVVIAAAGRQAPALVAAPLAGKVGGPLLLTGRKSLSRATATEVERLGARRAYVVGALAPRVRSDLRAAGIRHITTLRGKNRYQTAAKVARAMGGLEVYVTRGKGKKRNPSIADAFAIAGLAAQQQRPILLSRSKSVPAPTARTLKSMGIINAMLVGDEAKLGADVESAIAKTVPIVDRLDGAGRYRLSAAAADLAIQGIADESTAWVANAVSGMDALPAAAAVAQTGGVLLLLNGRDLDASEPVKEWLAERRLDLARLHVAGGPKRIAAATADQIRSATTPNE
jgi:putative cell wall-binding protein